MTSFTSRDEKGFPRYTSSGEESSLDQPRKGGRPHKAASVEEARAVQPKRRGRPSKTPNIEEETSTSESAVQPTKSGRPPKASSKSKNKPPAKKPRTENYSELEPTESLRLGHRFLFHIGAELKPGDTGLYTLCQIRSNKPQSDVLSAYREGSKSLGFNFEEVVNVDPRACVLPADKFAIMVEHGIPLMIDPKDEDPDADFCLTVTSYVEVWLCIAHLGDPELRTSIVQPWWTDFAVLSVGGRSLFTPFIMPFNSSRTS